MENKFNEKQINIFKGVLSLSAQGRNMQTITVKDIAAAANIGKGTVYEYFKSKEEIIASTILFSLVEKNNETRLALASKDTFKEKIYTIYQLIIDSIDDSLSVFNLIISNGGVSGIMEVVKDDKEFVATYIQDNTAIFQEIIEQGVKENVIKPQNDASYVEMVISANILSMGKGGMFFTNFGCGKDFEKLKANAYQMLTKALN